MDRDRKLDSLKGFLIVLVILGHVIGEGNQDILNKYFIEGTERRGYLGVRRFLM